MESIWQFSTIHKCTCKVIEEQTLWGEMIDRFWLPGSYSVVRILAYKLKSLVSAGTGSLCNIAYIAAATTCDSNGGRWP